MEAFRIDATGDPHAAVGAYLSAVHDAAQAAGDPWQVAALEASLDALDARALPSLGDAASDAALAFRTADGPVISRGLAGAASDARGPFARGLVARGLQRLAQRHGDAAETEKQRAASGCAREALVVGPTTWAAVTGVDDPDALDRPDAPIAASYAAQGAFRAQAAALTATAQGCAIGLSQESWRPGVRDVVVDVDVPRAQTVGLVLRAHGAATLRAGGTVVARRPFELGDGEAARFATVAATAGTLRLVARVGTAKEDDAVEIDAFDEDGAPLRAHAPAIGSTAPSRVTSPAAVAATQPTPSPADGDQTLLAAAAALASGSPREAERMLWSVADRPDARPDLALVYARAVESTRDLSAAARAERERSAAERVLEAWPSSWEATIDHAVLAGVRRGREEAGIESLRDLETIRSKSEASKSQAAGSQAPSPALLDAFEAITAGSEHLYDRAHAALERARGPLGGTTLLADAEEAASTSVGAERVATECDPARAMDHDTLACLDALRSAGDREGEVRELARLRALLGSPKRFLALELRDAVGAGDYATAGRAFAAMPPAERTLSALAMLPSGPTTTDPLGRILQMAPVARDAPGAIAPLLRAAGDDPTGDLDATAERLAAADRASPLLPNSATAILAHTERYEITRDGLLHWLLFDVRRVSGTTDVEENAQAGAPSVWGRAAMRALRRRILKKDGRILEPDRTPHASQEHADLSQLEQGDAVEAVYEGWSSPGDTGDLGIDTPDLLPERTSVHDATIELRMPRSLRSALWSHALLGKSSERVEGDTRIVTWHLVDHLARRLEDGVPKMDRSVAVSFSTAEWTGVARALRESIAALDEHDPEIAAWARDAAGPEVGKAARTSRETVGALVAAAGKALRESDPGTLSDYGGGIAPVQAQTARTFLASHGGSRSWLDPAQPARAGHSRRARRGRERPVQRRRGVPSPLRALHAPAGRRSSPGRGSPAGTPTSARGRLDRRRRGRPSPARGPRLARAPRAPGPAHATGRSRPSRLRRRRGRARRGRRAPRPRRQGRRAGHLRRRAARARRAGALRGALSHRGRRAPARAARRRARVAPVGERRRRAARVDRGQLAGQPARRRERQRLRAARGVQDVAAARDGHPALGLAARARLEPRRDVRVPSRTRERARGGRRGPVPRAPAGRAAEGGDGGADAGSARREGEARRRVAQADASPGEAAARAASSRTISSSTWPPGPSLRPSTTRSSGAATRPTTASWRPSGWRCLEGPGAFSITLPAPPRRQTPG